MFRTIADFESAWKANADGTSKIFHALTDQSLAQSVSEGHRNLGRIAWHIIQTLPEMAGRTGLKVQGPAENEPVPNNMKAIADAYDKAAHTLLEQIKQTWTDETLMQEDDMYGATWKRGLTLKVLIDHEIHHRGQMTVLMRQANLKVPGVFGPSKEEWETYGAPPPAI